MISYLPFEAPSFFKVEPAATILFADLKRLGKEDLLLLLPYPNNRGWNSKLNLTAFISKHSYFERSQIFTGVAASILERC